MATTEVAVLGGGCFWCLDAAFRRVAGVLEVQSGYAGGASPNPSYEAVCSGRTGHAEVVSVGFDPDQISFDEILDLFFALHDPTTLNRQGADTGTQYRSAIFPRDAAQQQAAQAKIDELERAGRFSDPIVTTIEPDAAVYPAEDYHQEYVRNNPGNRYCQLVVEPKLSKFFRTHADRLSSP